MFSYISKLQVRDGWHGPLHKQYLNERQRNVQKNECKANKRPNTSQAAQVSSKRHFLQETHESRENLDLFSLSLLSEIMIPNRICKTASKFVVQFTLSRIGVYSVLKSLIKQTLTVMATPTSTMAVKAYVVVLCSFLCRWLQKVIKQQREIATHSAYSRQRKLYDEF